MAARACECHCAVRRPAEVRGTAFTPPETYLRGHLGAELVLVVAVVVQLAVAAGETVAGLAEERQPLLRVLAAEHVLRGAHAARRRGQLRQRLLLRLDRVVFGDLQPETWALFVINYVLPTRSKTTVQSAAGD